MHKSGKAQIATRQGWGRRAGDLSSAPCAGIEHGAITDPTHGPAQTLRAEAVVEASDGDGRRRATEQGRRRALGRGLWMEIALEVERSWAFADDDDETTEQSAHS